MLTKICPMCNKEKELSEFPKDKNRSNGISSHCKQCKNEWKRSNATRLYLNVKETRKQNVEYQRKAKVWRTTNNAVRSGKLVRPSICSICLEEKEIEAHHEDYSKPLEIIWCCKDCHVELDRQREVS